MNKLHDMLSKKIMKVMAVCAVVQLLPFGEASALTETRVPENRVIYEVFVRNFSGANNTVGKFEGVEAQIPRLKELGVDVIWLMPFYTESPTDKWGTYPSPYAIADYRGIDSKYGNAASLRSLISAIHNAGMEVWLDWVGNHTGKDHAWVKDHPEYYKHAGNDVYNSNDIITPNDWSDVYQLNTDNHGNDLNGNIHAMHKAMIADMKYWVTEFDIDGYRCDHASGPSQEFWAEATEELKKNGAKISWLAEDSSEPELVTNGWFDYNWTWEYYGSMSSIMNKPIQSGEGYAESNGHTLYVRSTGSSYSPLYVYAWSSGEPELFGGWPGIRASGTESINGVTYEKFDIPPTEAKYNFIFNNNNGQQSGDFNVDCTKDIYVEINNGSPRAISDPLQNHYLYIEDQTGWDDFAVYAYGTSEFFGGFPGARGTNTVTINGKRYYKFDISNARADGNYTLIFSNNKFQDNGGIEYHATQISGGSDYYFTAYYGRVNSSRLDGLRQASAALHTDTRYEGRSRVMYTSSHDVVQDNDAGFNVFGDYQLPFTVLQFTVYGCPVIYNGQEVNFRGGRQWLSEKSTITWNGNANQQNVTNLYKDLIKLKHSHPSLLTGWADASYKNLSTNADDKVMAFQRGEGRDAIVVILNLSNQDVNNLEVYGMTPGTFRDMNFDGSFGSNEITINETTGFGNIPAFGYKVIYNANATEIEGPSDDNEPQTYHFYIDDQTGWVDFYLYVWRRIGEGGEPFLYGNWPGAHNDKKVVFDGRTWYDFPFTASDDVVQLIFNTGNHSDDNDPQKRQYDISDITLDRNYYFTAGYDSKSELNPELIHHFYIEDQTGWDNFYLHAVGDDFHLYGEMPGSGPITKTVIDGKSWYDYPFVSNAPADARLRANGAPASVVLTLHDGIEGNDNEYQITNLYGNPITLDRDYFLTAGDDRVVATSITEVVGDNENIGKDSEAVYYNLQGIRVANPVKGGVYIRRAGETAVKVVY